MLDHERPEPSCPVCRGTNVVVSACSRCRTVDGAPQAADDSPSANRPACVACGGRGGDVTPCGACRGVGRYEAQICVTVINLATGAVASRLLVAGTVPVERCQVNAARRVVDVGAMIGDLAQSVGAVDILSEDADTAPGTDVIPMPEDWCDSAPSGQKRAWQRLAFAEYAGPRRWRVVTAYPACTGAAARPSLPERWAALRDFAGSACIDLVVRHIDGWWSVHYELPGTQIRPEAADYYGFARDLAAVVDNSTPASLLGRMQAWTTAPGYEVLAMPDASQQGDDETATWTLDQLAPALRQVAEPTGSAMAVWRDGRWQLRAAAVADPAGVWRSGHLDEPDPADPAKHGVTFEATEPLDRPCWQGRLLPSRPCDCRSGDPVGQPCFLCAGGLDAVDPLCPVCHGGGKLTGSECLQCDGSGIVYAAAVVAVVRPDNQVHVRTVQAGGTVDVWLDHYEGVHAWRVPDDLTLDRCARDAGVGPGWRLTMVGAGSALTEFGLPASDMDLRDSERYGYVLPSGSTAGEPGFPQGPEHVVERYLGDLSAGRPGARVFLTAVPPRQEGSLEWLCVIARRLGARLDVSFDPTESPPRWGLELSPATHEPKGWPPMLRSLAEVTAEAVQAMPRTLDALGEMVPTNCSLNGPQQLEPATVSEDEDNIGRRLQEWAGRSPVWATLAPGGWTLRRIRGGPLERHVALMVGGASLREALARHPDTRRPRRRSGLLAPALRWAARFRST